MRPKIQYNKHMRFLGKKTKEPTRFGSFVLSVEIFTFNLTSDLADQQHNHQHKIRQKTDTYGNRKCDLDPFPLGLLNVCIRCRLGLGFCFGQRRKLLCLQHFPTDRAAFLHAARNAHLWRLAQCPIAFRMHRLGNRVYLHVAANRACTAYLSLLRAGRHLGQNPLSVLMCA